MTTENLAQHPEAFRACSKPVTVHARIAPAAGVVDTLEGPVAHNAGAAIVTGTAHESWPVERERFLQSYKAEPETHYGQDGYYTKHPKEVLALRLTRPHRVTLSQGRGQLQGQAGDYLVQYAPGDQAIVERCIFERTYGRLDS